MPVTTLFFSVSYTGTGSVGPFAFLFPISSPDALTVTQNDVVLPSTAYTVAAVNGNYENGGSVTLVSPCPSGQSLLLLRDTPLTQLDVFADNMPVPMETIEAALDKLTQIVQEQHGAYEPFIGPQEANTVFAGPVSGGVAPPSFRALVPADIPGGSGGGGGAGVTSVNALDGVLTLAAGTGITITQSGKTITIGLATAFTITSFTGGSTVEVGTAVTNPTFSASYSTPPASAYITNTQNISSPTNLVSPFTSATISGVFIQTSPSTTTFTLSATQGSTLTATQSISWQWAIFGGVGTIGATSSVISSGNNAILSNGNSIPRFQFGSETVGQILGTYSPSGQSIYLLLTGSSHTFTDNNTGFPMAFNAPLTVSFVNSQGVTNVMYLYQTTNSLTGVFTPKVAS